jgi:hypothetical protein
MEPQFLHSRKWGRTKDGAHSSPIAAKVPYVSRRTRVEVNSSAELSAACFQVSSQAQNHPDDSRFGIVAAEDLHLFQLDVNTVFLHGNNEEEEIYMVQPEGFETRGKEGHIWLLKKNGIPTTN